jgi:hypothetical protein
MAATKDSRPDRMVERLLGDHHSLPLSIALHLVPGALIVAVYLLITGPLVKAIGYPPFLAGRSPCAWLWHRSSSACCCGWAAGAMAGYRCVEW